MWATVVRISKMHFRGHQALRILTQGLDWRDDKHWSCNDNVHPSRHGTYDGITMHPFETVFVKASWHVGEPFTSHYTRWFSGHALGQARFRDSFGVSA